jgi:solute carrier family 8 (sodium/calcium exchanger)
MGVAIIADIFMVAIEEITSKRKQVMIKGKAFYVKTWNDTVANLTLMALGSSAPEILLACIECLSGQFFAGDLGPSTIVG